MAELSDFVLQTGSSQSLAHRLWRYADSQNNRFYAEGFCEEAEEVGPCTDRAGPCLVHYKRSRLTPTELNTWLATGAAGSCIVRAFWLGSSPGMASSKEDLVQQLMAAGPAPDGAPLRLQCYPRSMESWLGDQLSPSFNLQPVKPSWVLHVVQFDQQPGRPQQLLYSLQPAAEFYNYAPIRTKRVPDQLCKAAGKLAEALVATGVELTTGVAVDLGAAPGGWTHVLAQHAKLVIAVDPAELDSRALLPGVTHFACKAEAAVEQIHQLVGEAGVDLLVSDVNKHPSQIIEMLRPLLPLLRPGGAVVLTCKFFGRSAGREAEWRQRLADELGPEFERVQLLWLLANTQHEQTCVAFKAATATPAMNAVTAAAQAVVAAPPAAVPATAAGS